MEKEPKSQTNSTSGKIYTTLELKGLENFTSRDICGIIKACAQAGVAELRLSQEFIVSFRHTENLSQANTPVQASQVKRGSFPKGSAKAEQKIIDLAQVDERSADAEEEIQNLILTNPLEYESQEAQGALEIAKEEHS